MLCEKVWSQEVWVAVDWQELLFATSGLTPCKACACVFSRKAFDLEIIGFHVLGISSNVTIKRGNIVYVAFMDYSAQILIRDIVEEI